jgi:hypothetical protein
MLEKMMRISSVPLGTASTAAQLLTLWKQANLAQQKNVGGQPHVQGHQISGPSR